MSNQTVLNRLHSIIDQSDVASAADGSFERLVESHMEALEGIGLVEVNRARDLAYIVCQAHYLDGGEEFGDPIEATNARKEFHSFVNELERRIAAM